MLPGLLRTAYGLRYHRLSGKPLDSWLVIIAWGAAAFFALKAWLSGQWQPGLAAGLLLLLGLAILGIRRWAQARDYLVFKPGEALQPPVPQPMDPADKFLVHTTGRFEVEGKARFFAGLPGYWRTFQTREHAVMAIARAHRYLLLGSVPRQDIGMWYIFFRPEMLKEMRAGRLRFGTEDGPALRVRYLRPPDPGERRGLLRRASPEGTLETVYLRFEDEQTRCAVWADLAAGA